MQWRIKFKENSIISKILKFPFLNSEMSNENIKFKSYVCLFIVFMYTNSSWKNYSILTILPFFLVEKSDWCIREVKIENSRLFSKQNH